MLLALLLAASALQAPTMPASGTFNTELVATLNMPETVPGEVIYYTTDGTAPSPRTGKYTKPFYITNSCTLKAIATAPGYTTSTVAETTISLVALPPTISIVGTTVTITPGFSTNLIFYTIAGNLPTTSGARYTKPFTAPVGTTIRAIAAQTGWTTSAVVSDKVPVASTNSSAE
jgi:hypothetical protein